MKSGWWKSDWFLGAMVLIAVLAFSRFSDLIASLERKAYDLGVQASSRVPSHRIAVIAIDDTSIANLGRWPWSREVHVDPGYVYITRLIELAAKSEPQASPEILALLKKAEQQLNTDRRLAESYTKAGSGMVLGTPSYMSPEQLAGKKIEGRSDLFSLAVSLYQMLCGRLPFEGESTAQLMFKIANELPANILSHNPHIAPVLVAFLEGALAKNPDERFQTGKEFGGARRAALSAKSETKVDIQL